MKLNLTLTQTLQLYFRHQVTSATTSDDGDTKVQILAATHNGSYTLCGIKRMMLLHPHTSLLRAMEMLSEAGLAIKWPYAPHWVGYSKTHAERVVYTDMRRFLCVACGTGS